MKKRYSDEAIDQMLKEQEISGKTIGAWCREKKIPKTTFYGWRAKRNKSDKKSIFREIPVSNSSKSNITIKYKNIEIIIDNNISLLQDILRGIS